MSRSCYRWVFSAGCLAAATLVQMSLSPSAWAADDQSGWRSIYDVVMLWLNFGILAFLIVKFGRVPIMDFLKGRRIEIEREISRFEADKKRASDSIKSTLKALEQSEARLAEVKQRVVQQGERRKQQIIEEAQQQSRYMLGEAKRRIDSHILRARDRFKAELVEEAVARARLKLPQVMTVDDNQRLIDNYIKNLEQ